MKTKIDAYYDDETNIIYIRLPEPAEKKAVITKLSAAYVDIMVDSIVGIEILIPKSWKINT